MNKLFVLKYCIFSIYLAVSFFLVCPIAGSADFYSWVDEQGTFHATDDMSQVPKKYLKTDQQLSGKVMTTASDEWVLFLDVSSSLKYLYNRQTLIQTNDLVSVTFQSVYEPPKETGLRDENGASLLISIIQIDEIINCSEQAARMTDRRYYDKEGREIALLKKRDLLLPQAETIKITGSDPPLKALYKTICSR